MSSLQLARKLTVPLRRLPGTHPPIEFIRRRCYGRGVETVADFDRDLSMTLDLNEHMASQIFWFGYYSRDVVHCLDGLLRPGQTFFDCGANIGEITLVAAKRVGPTGTVVSFEPMDAIHARLAANVQANALTQVALIKQGVSDRPGRLPIYVSRDAYEDGSDHNGLGTLYAFEERDVVASEISLTTIDTVVAERGLARLDGIKLDIEGAELPAIRGAAEALRRFRPWLVIEIGRETCRAAGYEPTDILDALAGYRFSAIERKGRLRPIDRDGLAQWQNILCQPVDRV